MGETLSRNDEYAIISAYRSFMKEAGLKDKAVLGIGALPGCKDTTKKYLLVRPIGQNFSDTQAALLKRFDCADLPVKIMPYQAPQGFTV